MSKFCNKLDPKEEVLFIPERPDDFHCTCDYCQKYSGELFNTSEGKYYSNHIRRGVYPKIEGHICPGQVIGYRFLIQKYSQRGDFVLDPTVGTGTTIVESHLAGRTGIGIELEFPHITRHVLDHFGPLLSEGLFEGDCLKILETFKSNMLGQRFSLVLNGPPYPKLGGITSDAPQRKDMIVYENDSSLGNIKMGEEYLEMISKMYSLCTDLLLPGGYIGILVKDPVHKKAPFLLHELIIDRVLEDNPSLEYDTTYIHRHLPTTFAMNTYTKQHGEIPGGYPLFQTLSMLRKVK